MKYLLVSKFQSTKDIHDELLEVKKLAPSYDKLCRSFQAWKDNIEQNTTQLKILEDTGNPLRMRHQTIALSLNSSDPSAFTRAQREFHTATKVMDMWFREISDVNKERAEISKNHSINCQKQKASLQRSITNVELAASDLDHLEKLHQKRWKQFLMSCTFGRKKYALSSPASSKEEEEKEKAVDNNDDNNNNNKQKIPGQS